MPEYRKNGVWLPDLLTIGLLPDMRTEKGNDCVRYGKIAGQEEYDRF